MQSAKLIVISPQILYLDAFVLVHSSRELQNSRIQACVDFFRTHKVYWKSSLIFIPENAPGSRGGEIADTLKGVPYCITMEEFGPDKCPGVPKNRKVTPLMIKAMRNLLTNDAIHFSDDITTFPGEDADVSSRNKIVEQLCDELLAFKFVAKGDGGKYTGKGGVSGRDDLAVAALMGPYWSDVFYSSSYYDRFRRHTFERMLAAR